jgi:mycothiol synthase
MHGHEEIVARRGEVLARVLTGDDGTGEALRLLDEAERDLEVPLVDEAERARLRSRVDGDGTPDAHWHSLLARSGGAALGYAGVLLPERPGSAATGDVAVTRGHDLRGAVLSVLLAGLEGLAWQHDAGRLEVWVRHAEPEDVSCATDEGYGVDRRLRVLGRALHETLGPAPEVPGHRVRSYRTDEDDEGVVAVLAAAYAGTAEAGWDRARFAERRALPWFRVEDLLVAVDETGWIAGVHWLKRRTSTVGEVYNLAIHPEAQGHGLGALLLAAGLDHLRGSGCREALLWVDLANERAVRLYTSQGFTSRWEDVLFARTLRGTARPRT